MKDAKFADLIGKTLVSITGAEVGSERIVLEADDGSTFHMYHSQDCCESVYVEDIAGDVRDLVGTPILFAEESTSDENPDGVTKDYQDSFTWTFYRLSTINGTAVIRWYGESNGYYSESVEFALA